MTLTVGSLFSGIGGFDLGLERAGMQVRWQCEVDPYCLRVLAKHWPDVKRYGDIREVDWHAVERVDLVCGGFPCQDISMAGFRRGLGGDRSILWREFAHVIRTIRPRWVLAENVSALLSSDDGRFLGEVLRDLASCGYDAEWDCLPASVFGAAHIRDRFFLMAYPNGIRLQKNAPERAVLPQAIESEGNYGHTFAKLGASILPPFPSADTLVSQPEYVGVDHGLPFAVHRLRGLGNAVVPQVVEWLGRRILAAEAAL